MGDDEALVQAALMKHGADLQECALALTNLAEWGSTLDDLEEMGFKDRALNQQLLLSTMARSNWRSRTSSPTAALREGAARVRRRRRRVPA